MFAPFRKHKPCQSLSCATTYHVRLSGTVWHIDRVCRGDMSAAPFVFVQCIDKATDNTLVSGRLDKLSATGKSLVYQKIFTA